MAAGARLSPGAVWARCDHSSHPTPGGRGPIPWGLLVCPTWGWLWGLHGLAQDWV